MSGTSVNTMLRRLFSQFSNHGKPSLPMLEPRDDLGLQLYTVRHLLAADPSATLRAIRDAGYQHVELMDVEQLAALKPICDALELGIRSSFYHWTLLTGNQAAAEAAAPGTAPKKSLEESIDLAAAAGLTDLVFGYMLPFERSTADDYKLRAEQINRAGEHIQAAGMQQLYHHHSFEFKPLGVAAGQHSNVIERPDGGMLRGWDVLQAELDSSLTQFEVDVFWASLGGEDSVNLIEGLRDRVRVLHLKDVKAGTGIEYDERAVIPEAFRPVGEGRLDFGAILKAARAAGVAYCIVEQDESLDPLGDIRRSRTNLSGTNYVDMVS